MYEIELKAHVHDRVELTEILNSFAEYKGKVSKYDSYWKQNPLFSLLSKQNDEHRKTAVRIRIEKTEHEKTSMRTIVTCKHKQRMDGSGVNGKKGILEVNEEREFTVSDAASFEHLIINAGFSPFLTKHKECIQWTYEDILIELCNVEGLGDFLEAEIIKDVPGDIEEARIRLEKLLEKCRIPLEQIEPMYYSELLAAKKKKGAV